MQDSDYKNTVLFDLIKNNVFLDLTLACLIDNLFAL